MGVIMILLTYDLVVTMIQKSHDLGGYGMTPNVFTETSNKVVVTFRFLGLVGFLSLEEQNLWIPNQVVHDPETWTTPHLFHLKREYEVLVNNHGCLQDPPPRFSYYRLSNFFTRSMYTFRRYLNLGILDRFIHLLNTLCLDR